MKWLVEVATVEGEEKVLRGFLDGLGYGLEERSLRDRPPTLYLTSPKFEKFDSYQEVWECAQHLESTVGEVAELVYGINSRFELDGSVYAILPDGSSRKHVFESVSISVQASVSVSETVVKASSTTEKTLSPEDRERKKEQERRRREEKIKRAKTYVAPALENPTVLEVLRLSKDEQNPLNLGHIFDLIQADIGGEIEELVSQTQITRFTRSINHPEVFGKKSRHAVSNQEPPPNPMSLSEAREFVSTLLERWIEQKARKT